MEKLTPEEQRHLEELRSECRPLWELCLVQMQTTRNLQVLEILLRLGRSMNEQMKEDHEREELEACEAQRKRLQLIKN